MLNLKLVDVLEGKGRSLYWLASKSGVTYQTLSRLKGNKAKAISFDVLEKLCLALECQPGDLLVLSGNASKPAKKKAQR